MYCLRSAARQGMKGKRERNEVAGGCGELQVPAKNRSELRENLYIYELDKK
jgi:hypothetical protein